MPRSLSSHLGGPSCRFIASVLVVGSASLGCGASDLAPAPDPAPALQPQRPFRSPASIDVHRPFALALGRGSGRDGLDVVEISAGGTATLERRRRVRGDDGVWRVAVEWTDVPVSTTLVQSAVAESGVLSLAGHYDGGMTDGTQWILTMTQGPTRRVHYFDNEFPEAITTLARRIDELVAAVSSRAVWAPVPPGPRAGPADALWKAVREARER